MDEDKQHRRDLFACFALNGLIKEANGDYSDQAMAELAYTLADAMEEARKPKESAGLPAIRRRVKKGE